MWKTQSTVSLPSTFRRLTPLEWGWGWGKPLQYSTVLHYSNSSSGGQGDYISQQVEAPKSVTFEVWSGRNWKPPRARASRERWRASCVANGCLQRARRALAGLTTVRRADGWFSFSSAAELQKGLGPAIRGGRGSCLQAIRGTFSITPSSSRGLIVSVDCDRCERCSRFLIVLGPLVWSPRRYPDPFSHHAFSSLYCSIFSFYFIPDKCFRWNEWRPCITIRNFTFSINLSASL